MKLKEFVENFVEHNSIIRLWTKIPGGHKMIIDPVDKRQVSMEHKLLKGDSWNSKYLDCEVLGVTCIVVDGTCPEAINIVIVVED